MEVTTSKQRPDSSGRRILSRRRRHPYEKKRADQGDTTSMIETLIEAAEKVEEALPCSDGMQEVVADKGYHSTARMVDLAAVGVRSYVSEPKRGRRRWKGKLEARDAVYANRRRIRGARGRRLLRRRGELLERPCAHLYETGGMRRSHLRGGENLLKRLLIHVSAFNLGLLMRQQPGVGTPRGLQGRLRALAFMAPVAAEGQKRHHRLDLRSFRR